MDKAEVLYHLDTLSKSEFGGVVVDVDILRAAAELIRAGGWRPIAEAPEGKELRVGCYCGDRWFRPWYGVDKAYAIAHGYTHYLPEPEPPAREDSKS